jgi:hypothetical protein
MKYFKLNLLLFCFILHTSIFAQDTLRNHKDTLVFNTENVIKTAIELGYKIKQIKGLYEAIKIDHQSLFEIKGNYFNMGFTKQGFNTFELGVSKGKRDLFSITKFQEIHLNALFLRNGIDKLNGISLGISKSGVLFNKAIELQYVTDFNNQRSLILRPELGFTFFGTLTVNYGYNIMTSKIPGFTANVLHIRYTKQNFKKKIKEKLFQIKTTLEHDKERLKQLGINIPQIQLN